jgi:spore coat protein U-like protein
MPLAAVLPSWRIAAVVLAVCLLALPGRAHAACTASTANASFGTADSFTVSDVPQPAIAPTGLKCSGSLLALLSTNWITANVTASAYSDGSTPLLRNAVTGDTIPFTLCETVSCPSPRMIGGQLRWESTTFLDLLGLFNASDGSLPYLRTVPPGPVSAGTYTGVVTIGWSWRLCSAGALGLCVYDTGSATSTLNVTLIVTEACMITAPDLDFGSGALLSSFAPVTQAITIRCSKDSSYTVGIDDGVHAQAGQRRLANGGSTIAYDLYYPANAPTRWGSTAGQRVSSAAATVRGGTYNGVDGQQYTYGAQILPGLPPGPGIYTDTLTVDVQF